MQVIRFTASPEEGGKYGHGEIQLFDESGGDLKDGLSGKEKLVDLRVENFIHLISPGGALDQSLRATVTERPRRIIVLTNGFEYEPREGRRPPGQSQPNPHNALFDVDDAVEPMQAHELHVTPWLKRLNLHKDDLVVAYAFSSDPCRISTALDGGGPVKWARRMRSRLFGKIEWNGGEENSFAHAYDLAAHYALGLAGILAVLSNIWPEEDENPAPRVSFIAHSLGARVVTAVLRRLFQSYGETQAIEQVDKVILMAAALSQQQISGLGRDKWALMQEQKREPRIEFFNFTSRSDFVLNWIGAPLAEDIGKWIEAHDMDPDLTVKAERGERPTRKPAGAWRILLWHILRRDRIAGVHGAGSAGDWLNWIDIPLDHPQTRNWGKLAKLDLVGDLKECSQDHWVHYTHAPNWKLYRQILNAPREWSVQAIRTGRGPRNAILRPPLTANPGERYRPVIVSGKRR